MPEEPISPDFLQPKLEVSATAPVHKQVAFTVIVQSWATPIVAILMLVIGFFGGFYSRPLIETASSPGASGEVDVVGTIPTPTPDPERVIQQQALMETVTQNTRLFRGNPDAPITLIDFSDFQ